eukprot:16443176-Heterocapsa_arctica.AAC.1
MGTRSGCHCWAREAPSGKSQRGRFCQMVSRSLEHQTWENLRLVQTGKTCADCGNQDGARGMGPASQPS